MVENLHGSLLPVCRKPGVNVTQNIEIHNKDISRIYSIVASVENEVEASRSEASSEPSELHNKMENSPQLKRGFKRQSKSPVTNQLSLGWNQERTTSKIIGGAS